MATPANVALLSVTAAVAISTTVAGNLAADGGGAAVEYPTSMARMLKPCCKLMAMVSRSL